MGVFRCERFPTGEVPIRTSAGIVWFRDGQAVVDDPDTAAALREVPPVFGIVDAEQPKEPTGPETPTPLAPERPPHSAIKQEWVDYAAALGADRDQAEALTKAELIARYGSQ